MCERRRNLRSLAAGSIHGGAFSLECRLLPRHDVLRVSITCLTRIDRRPRPSGRQRSEIPHSTFPKLWNCGGWLVTCVAHVMFDSRIVSILSICFSQPWTVVFFREMPAVRFHSASCLLNLLSSGFRSGPCYQLLVFPSRSFDANR